MPSLINETAYNNGSYEDDETVMVSWYSGNDVCICSNDGDDSFTYGCNSYWYNFTGEIVDSVIMYNIDLMDELDEEGLEHIALHEMTHLFGLDDLGGPNADDYDSPSDDILEEYSIMFWSTGDITLPDLTEFDLYNLAWMYDTEE